MKTDSNQHREGIVLVFARAPVRGRIKTRLAPEVGDDRITVLYKCFVLDILNMLRGTGHQVWICYDPPEAGPVMRSWLGDHFGYQPQRGKDLGEKMADAFAAAFASGITKALVVGTDIPDLPAAVIDQGFKSLTEHEAVIGPAIDGGYYLIGFRADSFRPAIFENIPWSTPAVCSSTLDRLAASRSRVYLLPPWRDIDHYSDLCALADLLARGETSAPATAAFLHETGICRHGSHV
jgi:uncharacterized protein